MNTSAIYDHYAVKQFVTLLLTYCWPEFILLDIPHCKGGEEEGENMGIGEQQHCAPQVKGM